MNRRLVILTAALGLPLAACGTLIDTSPRWGAGVECDGTVTAHPPEGAVSDVDRTDNPDGTWLWSGTVRWPGQLEGDGSPVAPVPVNSGRCGSPSTSTTEVPSSTSSTALSSTTTTAPLGSTTSTVAPSTSVAGTTTAAPDSSSTSSLPPETTSPATPTNPPLTDAPAPTAASPTPDVNPPPAEPEYHAPPTFDLPPSESG